MDNFIEITPWWVYLLFLYFLAIGIRASRPQVVSLTHLFILPLILTIWSLFDLLDQLNGRWGFLFLWVATCSSGFFFGTLWGRKLKLSLDKVRKVIYLPGSWLLLILTLIFFSIRCTFDYFYAVHPKTLFDPTLFSLDACLSGLVVGLLIGRFTALWIRYHYSIE